MTGDTVGKVSDDYRRKRVRRIKRIIIITCICLLLAPTVFCVFLLFKINSLEERLDRMTVPETVEVVSGPGVSVSDEPETEVTETPVTSGAATDYDSEPVTRKVYLTFDDGPGPNTEKILDILKKYDVKATFFVTGKEDTFSEQMYKRIVDEGHTLGMHSYSHVYDEIYASEDAFTQDLEKLSEYLYDVTGTRSVFYRFPGGSSVTQTQVPIENLIYILEDRGITYLDWNVLSPDIRDGNVSKKQMISEIMEDVNRYETSVILFYDTQTQPMTVKALPKIIKKLQNEGCEILPVDENTAPIRHNQ